MILVAIVQTEIVSRSCVQTGRLGAIQGGTRSAQSVIKTIVRLMTRRDPIRRRRRWLQTFRVAAVGISVKATPYQGVGRHVPFTNERMTLENFDAGRSSQHGSEQGWMIRAGRPRERRIQRQETRVRRIAVSTLNVSDRGAIVQRLDGEESRDLLAMLVDILQE